MPLLKTLSLDFMVEAFSDHRNLKIVRCVTDNLDPVSIQKLLGVPLYSQLQSASYGLIHWLKMIQTTRTGNGTCSYPTEMNTIRLLFRYADNRTFTLAKWTVHVSDGLVWHQHDVAKNMHSEDVATTLIEDCCMLWHWNLLQNIAGYDPDYVSLAAPPRVDLWSAALRWANSIQSQ